MNLRWSWHQETLDLFASVDPELWRDCGGDPVRLLGAVSPARLSALSRDKRFLRRLSDAADDLADYLSQPRWYQEQTGVPSSIAYFSPGVRPDRGAAAVLRRPRHPRRRPPQGGQRPRRPDHRRRPALPGRLLRPGAVPGRLAAGALPVDRPARPAAVARSARPTARALRISLAAARRPHAARPGLEGPGRPGAAAAARLRHRGERRRRAAGHRPALRRRQRAPAGAGDAARRRRRAGGPGVLPAHRHAGARGVPHQRGPRRLPRPRADARARRRAGLGFDEALQAVRAGTVFTTHTPVPAGIDRFASDLVAALLRRRELGRAPGRAGARARRRERPAATVFNMAHMGLRLAQRANGVSQAARRGQPGDVQRRCGPASTPTRCRSPRSPTACTRRPGCARELLEIAEQTQRRHRRAAHEGSGWQAIDKVPTRSCGRCAATLRERLVDEIRRRLRASWLQRGFSDAELDWIDTRVRPGRAHDRLRPPGALLQAADADAARPGPAAGAAAATRSGRCRS